ncbi:MAG: hypothetical protein ABW219_10715 [Ilumatobacteraceae bacterium]
MKSVTETASAAARPADPVDTAAVAIGGLTAASGLALIAMPRFVLWALGAGRAEPSPFLFRIIGMFMTVSGGLLADAARSPGTERAALRWSLVGKVGAASAIVVGVRRQRFGKQAMALAAFDAAAAGLVAAVIVRTPSSDGG